VKHEGFNHAACFVSGSDRSTANRFRVISNGRRTIPPTAIVKIRAGG